MKISTLTWNSILNLKNSFSTRFSSIFKFEHYFKYFLLKYNETFIFNFNTIIKFLKKVKESMG